MLFDLSIKSYLNHEIWMKKALILAEQAAQNGDIPVGALMVDNQGNLIAESGNQKEEIQDPTAHAELLVIQKASRVYNSLYLNHCTLYVTLEPCIMCTGAIIHSRLGLLVYGADDPKTGSIRTVFNLPDSVASNHRLKVISGVCEDQCKRVLKSWFHEKRNKKRKK